MTSRQRVLDAVQLLEALRPFLDREPDIVSEVRDAWNAGLEQLRLACAEFARDPSG